MKFKLPKSSHETPQSSFFPENTDPLRYGNLQMMYGDTLPDGGHMAAKMKFGNDETLLAIARIMKVVHPDSLITEELDRRSNLYTGTFEPDPDDQAHDRFMLHGEAARQTQGTLEDVADERYPLVDVQTVQMAKILVGQTFGRLDVPKDMTPDQQAFYVPVNSYHEQATRASVERQLQHTGR